MSEWNPLGAFARHWFDACTKPVILRHGGLVSARGENDGCSGGGGNGGVKTGAPTEPRGVAGSAFSVTGGNAEGGRSSPLPPRASVPFPVPRRSVRRSRNRPQTSIRRHLGAIPLVFGLVFASAIPAGALHAQSVNPQTVSILADAFSVTEGEPARFTLNRRSHSVTNFGPLNVELEVTKRGDFVVPNQYPLRVEASFGLGVFSTQFSRPTVDDHTSENNGSISVRVLPPLEANAGQYQVGAPAQATVKVLDNELPLISVAPGATTVTEGTSAEFRIIRTGSDRTSLSVEVEISGHKKIMSDATRQLESTNVTILAGASEASVVLTTEADTYNEGDGEITVAVVESPSYQTDGTSTASVLVEDDDIPEVTLAWISPQMTLVDDVWVGEIVEGQDIFYQMECSGNSLAPPGKDSDPLLLNRFIARHQEILNNPHVPYDVDSQYRFPCSNEPRSDWVGPFPHGDRRFTGALNGEIRVDLAPQMYELNTGLSACYLDSHPGTPEEVRFCPKYTIGTVNSARITVLNRNPTITVEANTEDVIEGETARFTVRRHWVADLLDHGGADTKFDYRFESTSEYSNPSSFQALGVFRSGANVIHLNWRTTGDRVGRPDGEVTLEILPGTFSSNLFNVDGQYEVHDHVPGITPPGGNSRIASVEIFDDDPAGVTVTPTSVTVREGGDSTYTVVLESKPTGPVTVTPSVGGSPDVTVSPSALTFTPTNWNEARTVTVSALDDVDVAPDTATVSHAVSGADYGSVLADDVTVAVSDSALPSTTVELRVSIDEVEEDAGATLVTVTGTLNGASRVSATSLTVSVGATEDGATEGTDYATVSELPLSIGAGHISGTATFTLTPEDDDVDEEDEALAVEGSTTVTGLAVTGTTVTISDNDTRGVDVTGTSLTIPEGGDSMYTVVLESEPTGPVTVTPSVFFDPNGDITDVAVSPPALTFTPGDWGEARTVTVSALDDVDAEPDTATVNHAVSGADYGAVLAGDVAVTVTDDDTPSKTVELTTSIDEVEEGAVATSVTVTGTLSDAPFSGSTYVRVFPAPIGVTAMAGADYEPIGLVALIIDSGQSIGTAEFTLTVVDDDIAEGDEVLVLSGSSIARGLSVRPTTVTIVDNDTAQVMGVNVTPGDAQLVVEWTAVDNATGYMVQWKSGSDDYNTGDRQFAVTSGSTTSYTIPDLDNGTQYTVRVIATRTGANNGLPSAEITGRPASPFVTGGISLCAARLDAAEPVWRQAELDICWEVGNSFGTGSNTVIEWQQHFFWGENDANPWTPWKVLARGDTYTPCRNSASCVQHTQKGLFRGSPFTYRMRIRTGGVTVFESQKLEAQAPNSDATGLVPGISGGFLPGTVEFVDVPTGPFWFDLVFNDTDPIAKVLMVETVQGLAAADLVVTNATATVELFDDVYKVTLTPVTLGQPVTAHLPANTVKGVGEGITSSGGNNYTRDNVASNTMTWQTAPPANPS